MAQITFTSIKANLPLADSEFKMPAAAPAQQPAPTPKAKPGEHG
jgi:hypothetical protein